MYYVVKKNEIISSKNLRGINKRTNAKFENDEFQAIGSDFITIVNEKDMEFVQDKKRLALIPLQNLYKSENTGKIMLGIIVFMQLIILVKR